LIIVALLIECSFQFSPDEFRRETFTQTPEVEAARASPQIIGALEKFPKGENISASPPRSVMAPTWE
jgi:hypothetical protein